MSSKPQFQSAQPFKIWKRLRFRLISFLLFICCLSILFFLRAFYLQVIKGNEYYIQSKKVSQNVVSIIAPRGEIYDRNYHAKKNIGVLASNKVSLSLSVLPTSLKKQQVKSQLKELEFLLQKEEGVLQSKLKPKHFIQNRSISILDNLTTDEITVFSDYSLRFSNFFISQKIQREYNYGPITSHITGYIGLPSKRELKQKNIKTYHLLGKNGLEKYYNDVLKGKDGEIIQVKTALGKIEEQKVYVNIQPGHNLVSTVDMGLQKKLYELMLNHKGAAIVLHANTGEVLALVSKPDFDPNVIINTNHARRKEHIQYMLNEKAELNRVISTKFPPASTLKPLIAMAALEEQLITKNQYYNCTGKYTIKSRYRYFDDFVYRCWDKHRKNNLEGGIAHSCNAYFYQLGHQIGAKPMIKYLKYFQIASNTNLDLPGEIVGLLPTFEWKEKVYQTRWYDGDTVNLSVGQGFMQTTLLGMLKFYQALATNGVVYKPMLVKEIHDTFKRSEKQTIKPEISYELSLSKKNIRFLLDSLNKVIQYGTASHVFRRYPKLVKQVAGKTGTVQVHSERQKDANQHAIFMGIYPYNAPINEKVIIGVFIDKGLGGAVTAAPVARDIFHYLSQNDLYYE